MRLASALSDRPKTGRAGSNHVEGLRIDLCSPTQCSLDVNDCSQIGSRISILHFLRNALDQHFLQFTNLLIPHLRFLDRLAGQRLDYSTYIYPDRLSTSMRLLNTRTLKFQTFFDESRPRYAILSHRWTDEETTLQEFATQAETLLDRGRASISQRLEQQCASMKQHSDSGIEELVDFSEFEDDGNIVSYLGKMHQLEALVLRHCSPGVGKVWRFCKLASHDGYEWVWADTCCIDKSSSAELTEAINSMFSWYANSDLCYAYLNDVSESHTRRKSSAPWRETWEDRWEGQLRSSAWFRRGWTLQELLAPRKLCFYDMTWRLLGSRDANPLGGIVSDITNISSHQFGNVESIRDIPVGIRMSWVSLRQTSRVEDMAYCMLGILEIYMPLIYGEGWNAFRRLQEELIARNPDESIFCWNLTEKPKHTVGVLATRPQQFSWLRDRDLSQRDWFERAPHRITNRGLEIEIYQPRDAAGSVFERYGQPDDEERQRALLVPLNVRLDDGGQLCLTMRDVVSNNLGQLGKRWRRAGADGLVRLSQQDLSAGKMRWQRHTVFLQI